MESWDNTQSMMEADFELAQRLQAEEQGETTIEERSRLFVELMNRRKKHFAKLRAEEIRRKPPTKAQKRNQISTYLKNMAGYKHKVVKGSETRIEESSKRAGDELESDMSKKQKIDEHVEVEKDDQEEAEMKRHIEIVKDDEVAIDAIPLATKPPVIVEYKIDKDRRMGYFKLIRADGSSKRYSSMIKMLQGIDREDLETLWKLVKAKHENTRPEEDYERVLWDDLKVMFKPDIKSEVWRNLQGYKNKRLQADRWNEMCYQLLKLMTKQEKGLGPLIWPSIMENRVTRPKKYPELSATEALHADYDIKATDIILQGLPSEVYSLERKCKLYDEFDKFAYKKGESLHEFYLRFSVLLNDMNIYNMKLEQFQVNTKFLNTLPTEWSKFMTYVKLVQDLHTTNIDQLHAYLGQHEFHANEVRLMHERNLDPLALVVTHRMTQSPYQTHQNSHQNTQFQPQVLSYQSPRGIKLLLLWVIQGPMTREQVENSRKQRTVILYIYKTEKVTRSKQCNKPKRKWDDLWFKDKVLLVQAHLCHPFVQSNVVNHSETEITSDSNIIPYSQYLIESQQVAVQNSNSSAQQDDLILSVIEH
ncbi:hypothetical protein Tco_0158777 [Tanacetum coccineum]